MIYKYFFLRKPFWILKSKIIYNFKPIIAICMELKQALRCSCNCEQGIRELYETAGNSMEAYSKIIILLL